MPDRQYFLTLMTRVTNFGRKRTYLEANQDDAQAPGQIQEMTLKPSKSAAPAPIEGHSDEPASEPPKKRRKRPFSKKKSGERKASELDATSSARQDKKLDKIKKVTASEERRLKRIKQKLSQTTCFACRKYGHAAKDCPKSNGDGQEKSNVSIGICYRCGSRKHSLSRCNKPNNPEDPFPFASCFVCNGKGHLASGCPQNKGKGIYPNGGCCKLCGETTHLARNCTMRQKANDPVLIGIACETGADEDDFHTLKRTTLELERAEKREEKVKKMLEAKKGVVSGVVVRSGNNIPLSSDKKKVVVFK